jgi:class 3 adenylate cyclase/pimeloyl-ACP methyl ester carboxylesterase
MAPQTRYARNGDVHIAYQALGDGPLDLLFVPQSFSQVEHLQELAANRRFLERLATFTRLILFDRRESGLSDRLGRPPTLEEQMDDVIAVLDAVGSERAGVMAMLEGGPMAMLFAATYPERVHALVLYATFARTTWAEGYEWALPVEERRAHFEALYASWGDGAIFLRQFAPSLADDERTRAWLGAMQRLSLAPRAARAIGDLNERLDMRGVLPSIRVPTLVLHRRDDTAIDLRHSHYLAERIPGARLVLLPGEDCLPFVGDSEAFVGEVEEFLTGARGRGEADRVLATVLFADIVDSTTRAAELGDARWRDLLAEYYELVSRRLERWQGRLVKTIGDGVLATFDGPARALRAARAVSADVRELGVDVRVGLHTGEVELIGGDVGGLAVHIAARVTAEAALGEVLVSSTVKDLVVGSGHAFTPRGTHALRGVPGEWPLWSLQ